MKASHLINLLSKALKRHGDLEIWISADDIAYHLFHYKSAVDNLLWLTPYDRDDCKASTEVTLNENN